MALSPVHLDPLWTPNVRRKDLVPLTVIVQYIVARAVTEAMQQWGKDIRLQGRISHRTDTRRSTLNQQIHASQIAGERNQIISGPTRCGASLPTSNYLYNKVLLASPA